MTSEASGAQAQLLFALAILLATGLALLAAGHGGGGTAGPPATTQTAADPALDPDRLVRIAVSSTPVVARRVERIRELAFAEIPEPRVVSARRLGRIERRELSRSGANASLAVDEAVTRMLGLLGADEQLEDAVGASAELAAAAYDPESGRLYVVSDAVAPSRALVVFVLAHELTHAIEDEAYGLWNPGERDQLDDDAALAALALTEGTATSLMIDYADAHLNPLALAAAAAELEPSTGAVPEFVVEQLEWAYLGGTRFVNRLRAIGGGWDLVDYAIGERPPATTEQVLHPGKYLRGELPDRVQIDSAELRARGWRRADRSVAGEYPTRQLLETGVAPGGAAAAAAGWDGDRYELYRRAVAPRECAGNCREDLVLVLRWRWERRGDAVQFARAAVEYLNVGLGAEDSGESFVFEGAGAAALVIANPREVALVFAPSSSLARTVAEDQVSARLRSAPETALSEGSWSPRQGRRPGS